MALVNLTDPDAVVAAVVEFDRICREAFLSKYGFAGAKGYFVVLGGRRYDSKAVAGVAHLFQHGVLMGPEDFSGGDATVAKRLERLGFEVIRPVARPDWSVDELMFALNLYLRTRSDHAYRRTTRVAIALSEQLRMLRIFDPEVRSDPRFRNPNGVSLKLHNFPAIDPEQPNTGMGHGSAADCRVWDDWAHRPHQLAEIFAIRRERGKSDDVPGDTGEDEEYEASEGRILFRTHRRYERDRTLAEKKKAAVLRRTGRLACEVCDFDSFQAYDIDRVVDVHHVVPLHQIGQSTTNLDDLAVVCPTCHRVLHKHHPIITPAELRKRRESSK
ncbi:HNH endonuclease [Cellulosimicrobium funkei]